MKQQLPPSRAATCRGARGSWDPGSDLRSTGRGLCTEIRKDPRSAQGPLRPQGSGSCSPRCPRRLAALPSASEPHPCQGTSSSRSHSFRSTCQAEGKLLPSRVPRAWQTAVPEEQGANSRGTQLWWRSLDSCKRGLSTFPRVDLSLAGTAFSSHRAQITETLLGM